MKTFKEFVSVDSSSINESADVRKKLVELNKGREGKTAIAVDGGEIRGSVYLGDGGMASAVGSKIEIERFSMSTGKYETTTFTKDQVKWLSKI